jgi:hypothetical protein
MNIVMQPTEKVQSAHRLESRTGCIAAYRHIHHTVISVSSDLYASVNGRFKRTVINRSRGNCSRKGVSIGRIIDPKLGWNSTVCIGSDASRIHSLEIGCLIKQKLQFESSSEYQYIND